MRRTEFSAWTMIVISTIAGSLSASLVAGCKPKHTPPSANGQLDFTIDNGTPDSNVTATAEVPGAIRETPVETAAATTPGAVDSKAHPKPSVDTDSQTPAARAERVEKADSLPETKEMKLDGPGAANSPVKPVVEAVAIVPAVAEAAKELTKTPTPKKVETAVDHALSSDIGKIDDPRTVIDAGGDWPQWGGTRWRNNAPGVTGLPKSWKPGKFDRRSGSWDKSVSKNIRWVSNLGSQTYGNPVVAGGQVYVGSNNGSGHVARYPSEVDLGVLLCFDEKDGHLLWQHSSEKLITGRVHDWPLQGICCSPLVEGEHLWFVTNRGEVRCLDTKGFHDDEDDGPLKNESVRVVDMEVADSAYKETLSKLDDGQLTDAVKTLLENRGEKVTDEVTVTAVEAGKAWTLTGTFAGTKRTLTAKVIGPRITISKALSVTDKTEADVIWVFDMMKTLGSSQHNMASCSVTSYGDLLFVNTSNGQDESHINLPAPNAPSFFCMNKNTAEVYWTDRSPGENILHGQWSSPAVGELGGVPQVIFAAGDGIVYSFRADKGVDGKPELLWQFDANPKESVYLLGGEATRNSLIGTPVIYNEHVYIAVGEDPEHGEGDGHLYCLDPTKRGDISLELAMKVEAGSRVPIPHKRIQAVDPKLGEVAVANPNAGAVWHYTANDQNKDGEVAFEETMHRTIGTVAIKDDLLYVTDLSGVVHCLDAKAYEGGQPKVHFTFDMLAQSWGSPLIADGRVFLGDEDGDIAIFELGADNKEPVAEINMGTSIYSTPVAANGTIFISTKDKLFAISTVDAAKE